MNILGIDPGKSGCLALLNESGGFKLHDIEGNIAATIHQIQQWASKYKIDGVVIEGVSPMPLDGVHNAFAFGRTVGELRGACLALSIPIIAEPRPSDWKKRIGIALNPPKAPKKPKRSDFPSDEDFLEAVTAYTDDQQAHKQAKARYKRHMDVQSAVRAIELFPKAAPMLMLKKHADRAESLLLAHLGMMTLRGNG
jgi:hypothetical protein